MSSTKKAVYFFCTNLDIDPAAGHVFDAVSEMHSFVETSIIIDDYPVLKHLDDIGNEFYFVRTGKVVCHDYRHYLPIMNSYFSGFDMAGLVTWHEGQNAPDKIFRYILQETWKPAILGMPIPFICIIYYGLWRKIELPPGWRILE